MIRHFDGTSDTAQKISAQSKRGAVWVVQWTWQGHRICETRKEAERVKEVWRAWYKKIGWRVIGDRAFPPGFGNNGVVSDLVGHVHVCYVAKYDPQTRERVE